MIEFKQLQYFIACAETGSFSKAAERLFTTQPNVSKVIKAMELEIDASLFQRGKDGIILTEKGKHVYEHAMKVMEEMDFLQDISDAKEETWLRISCMPSSKLADLFVDFYEQQKEADLHYRVYSTGMNDVVQRVKDGKADIGIVFVEESREVSLQYLLVRYRLEFIPLKHLQTVLYLGGESDGSDLYENTEEDKKIKLIQSYYDEINNERNKIIADNEGVELGEADPVIITNSDYIKQRILDRTGLCNISGDSILPDMEGREKNRKNIVVQDSRITFGFICRKSEDLSQWAAEFVRFIKSRI